MPPLPSCSINRRVPAEPREGAFLAPQAVAQQFQLYASLAGAGHRHAPRWGEAGCQRWVPGSGDRDEDVNGGADGWENQGSRADGSELLIGFDTLGFGIPDGEAGKVGSEARGREQRLGSCLGSKEPQCLPELKKKQDFQVVTSTH